MDYDRAIRLDGKMALVTGSLVILLAAGDAVFAVLFIRLLRAHAAV